MILYADDAVIFKSGKNSAVVAEKHKYDLTTLGNFFLDNSRVVNHKKSKTEFLLFGSHKHRNSRTRMRTLSRDLTHQWGIIMADNDWQKATGSATRN